MLEAAIFKLNEGEFVCCSTVYVRRAYLKHPKDICAVYVK